MAEHEWITYIQSGMYWTDSKAAYRGLDPDSLTHDDALDWLRSGEWRKPMVGSTTRFIGSGTGLGTPRHRCWITDTKEVRPGLTGKRIHITEACPHCRRGYSAADVMHPTIVSRPGGVSLPHDLPWLRAGDPWAAHVRGIELAERYDHVFNVA